MSSTDGLILVVDDNEMNRDMMVRRLERYGYRIEACDNGREALEKMKQESFDLVLLDVMMPGMNGYEVLEAIKTDPVLRFTPVVMISAMGELDSVARCIELGAEDYLFKPFNPVLLKARVHACIEKKQLIADSLRQQLTMLLVDIENDAKNLTSYQMDDDAHQQAEQLLSNIRTAITLLES